MNTVSTELHQTIADQEKQIATLTRQLLSKNSENSKVHKQVALLHTHVQTLNTLSQGLFSLLDAKDIYQLACTSIVHQLGWNCAFVVSLQAENTVVLASYQATEGQVRHVTSFAHKTPHLVDASVRREVMNTFTSQSSSALALRVLFQTDEVVALPLIAEEQLFGYLIACAHTIESLQRTGQDVSFLALIAAQTANAVQSSSTVTSLEKQNIKLHELDELKNSFISITSHQLRTPLSIVKWILSILQSDPELVAPSFEKQRILIGQAYESNERLIHVVNDLLNVSRIENGRLPYNPQLVSLQELLQDVVNGVSSVCVSKGIRLEVHIDSQVPLIKADPILFREAFQDLFDNAIDYNIEGGFIRLSASARDGECVITLTNSGMGIQPGDIHKIFTQFYRCPESIKLFPNGSGLGLYLANAIIDEHGGNIFCHSEPGVETSFTVLLPLS